MTPNDPLYQLAVELQSRSAMYYKAGDELNDLGKLILRVQGQPDLLRGMIATIRQKLDDYEAMLPAGESASVHDA